MKQSMILLHGLFGGLSNWHGVIAHFKADYELHIPELPIFDRHSSDPLAYLTDYLEFYINKNSLTNVMLVGNSLGGHVAIL